MNTKIILAALLSASTLGAFAADLPRKSVVPATIVSPVPVSAWEGGYVGGFAGYSWLGKGDLTSPLSTTRVTAINGFGGGLQAGYDYQFNSFVLGFVGDISLGNVRGNNNGSVSSTVYVGLQGSLRARAGFLVTKDLLLYATGGLAMANTKVSNPGSFSTNRTGYVVGLGAEYKLDRNWSAFLEGRYMDLGKWTYDSATPVSATYNGLNARVGVNYRF